jgi:hypothetical protein
MQTRSVTVVVLLEYQILHGSIFYEHPIPIGLEYLEHV